MEQRVIIYTTTKSHWFTINFPYIKECLELSEGRKIVSFDVQTINLDYKIPTYRDYQGHKRPSWDWFKERFSSKTDHNVVCLHLSEYWRDKLGLSKHIGGTYLRDPGPQMDFFIVADKRAKKKGYTIDEFTRRFIHEMLHGDTHFTEQHNFDWVHEWDYTLNAVDKAPAYISYTSYNIKKKTVTFLEQIILLYEKIKNISTPRF